MREGRLIGRVQVHDDVNRRDQDFSENEYDHDPFEQFSLKIVNRYSTTAKGWLCATYMCDRQLVFKHRKEIANNV